MSRSAVSRTFTDGASVSDSTRRKVLAAAESLGYHVNHLARGLIREHTGIVCLIVADMNTPYQARMLEALSARLQAIKKVAMVINTSGEQASVERAVRQTLHYRADATIVLSGTPAAALIETCIKSGQRVILINRDDHLDGTVNMVVDNRKAAEQAFSRVPPRPLRDLRGRFLAGRNAEPHRPRDGLRQRRPCRRIRRHRRPRRADCLCDRSRCGLSPP